MSVTTVQTIFIAEIYRVKGFDGYCRLGAKKIAAV